MVRKMAYVGLMLFIINLLTSCLADSVVEPDVAAEAASRRRSRPIANAGADASIKLPTSSVLLDGSQSKDPDGTIKKYEWAKITGPASSVIVDPAGKTTTVNDLIEGLYTFRLTITDDRSLTASDDVLVSVTKDGVVYPPTITSFSPTSAIIGATVTITGTNFGTAPVVSFNGITAVVSASTATSITTTVPFGATTGPITVTANGLTAQSNSGFYVLTTVTSALYFQGNMDNVSLTAKTSEFTFNGWADLKSQPFVQGIYLNNLGGVQYAFQEIRKDPTNSQINTLYAQAVDDDPNMSGTSRAQMTIGISDASTLNVYHTSHRMYLSPDIAYLTNYPSAIGWFTLFEIWNQPNSAWAGSTTGSCRWNISLFKATGTGQPLYWHVEAELMQPSSQNYQWRIDNKTAAIPLGKWFTIDVYMKRGEGTNGRFTVKITVDGGATTTLFDIANTTVYPGYPNIQVGQWQPFKLYTSDAILDWMRTNNKAFYSYYNDFKWYQD